MAFQPAPACAQATLTFRSPTTGDFYGQNVLNFVHTGGTAFTQTNVDDLADLLVTWEAANYAPIRHQGTELSNLDVRGISSAVDVFALRSPGTLGVQVGDIAPSKVTLALAFGTGFTGRTARGRVFMCALTESQLNGKVVSTAYADAAIDCWEALQTALSATSFRHVVLSRTEAGVKRVNALPQVVTTYTLTDNQVDTRRLRV